MSFTLHPAQEKDIPALAALTHNASKPDAHTQLKARYVGYDHQAVMTDVLHDWVASPSDKCRVLKAVDDDTTEILGWVVWGLRGYDGRTSVPNQVGGHVELPDKERGVARLGELTSTDMRQWMDKLMPAGTKCMFIQSIVVGEAHQGKGIGSALIRNGTSQADKDGVFCWVHSSDGAWQMFAQHGFEEVGRLSVDLDEFEQEELAKRGDISRSGFEGGDEGRTRFGTYVFRYMKREPHGASST